MAAHEEKRRVMPNTTAYTEAVQTPRLVLNDDELKGGETATNVMGLPLLWSGAFANVYKIQCAATKNTWALKCFTRDVPGQRERYRKISEHLERSQLPFTVDFQYLESGIRIGAEWFPALKMRWVEGLTLSQFVEEHLERPRNLRMLLDLWVKLASRLREKQIAHADLQHGNVLLVPQEGGQLALRLIDYDGMFVPELAGTPSGEAGHPAFQHPQRLREGTYNAEVDRFSHLAIFTAIQCLIVDRRDFWQKFNNDDNLLFREADFREPSRSDLLHAMWESKDAGVRSLAGRLVLACHRPLEESPLLDDVVVQGKIRLLSQADQAEVESKLTGKPIVPAAAAPSTGGQIGSGTAPPPLPPVVLTPVAPPSRSAIGKVGAAVASIDRSLFSAFGIQSSLARVLIRVAAGCLLAVGIGVWMSRGPTPSEQLAETPEGQPSPGAAEKDAAMKTKLAVESLFGPGFRPASFRQGSQKLAEADAAFERGDLDAAHRGYEEAVSMFGQSRGEVSLAADAQQSQDAWKAALAAADRDSLEKTAGPAFQNAQNVAASALASFDAGDAAAASRAYQDATALLAELNARSGTLDKAKDAWTLASNTADRETLAKHAGTDWDAAQRKAAGAEALLAAGKTNDAAVAYQEASVLLDRATIAAGNAIKQIEIKFQAVDAALARKDLATAQTLFENLAAAVPGDPRLATLKTAIADANRPMASATPTTPTKPMGEEMPATTAPPSASEADDTPLGEKIRAFALDGRGTVSQVFFSPNGQYVAAVGDGLTIWDAGSGAKVHEITGVGCAAFSSDGQYLITGRHRLSSYTSAVIWNVGTWQEVKSLTPRDPLGSSYMPVSIGEIRFVGFGAIKGQAFAAGDAGKAVVWDIGSALSIRSFGVPVQPKLPVTLSPDGRNMAAVNSNVVVLCDLMSGKTVRAFPKSKSPIVSAAVASGGRLALAGLGDGSASVLEGSSGKQIRSLAGHQASVTSVAVSPNGKRLLTGSSDKTAAMWETSSGTKLRLFRGHTAEVAAIAFSPNGLQVLTASPDGTVILWNASDVFAKKPAAGKN